MRLDQLLVTYNHTQTKSQANRLIKQGLVFVNGVKVEKPAKNCTLQDEITISDEIYVSRGAYKLRKAIEEFNITVTGKVCADIGASTGGFTQILLQHNAEKVFAIDVGTDQLHPSLIVNPKVVNLPQTHILKIKNIPEKIDLVVVDLSFISLRKVLPHMLELFGSNTEFVLLFKPQFEVGREINKKGVIKPSSAIKSRDDFLLYLSETFSLNAQHILSPISGQCGNIEFLVHFKR